MPVHDPLSPDDERLLSVAVAIADGTPVDWPSVDSPLVCQLRHLERLVQGHDAMRSTPPRRRPAQETLLTEARRTHAGAADALRVQWGPVIVFEKIGRGSFGDVYRAWDPRLDREVALKLIPEDLPGDAASPVIEEGRLLARVRHPNVMTVYGADRCEGRTGIWTEYIRGETLAAEVGRRGPLPADEAVGIAIDVCAALGAVHAAGMLHRDVKAQNILRDGSGRIVLGDFGTGIALADDDRLSDPRIAGTPLYLAPEVIAGRPATVASDLYGVGVLLYFLLTATFPVGGSTLAEIRRAHAQADRMPLRDTRADVPEALAGVVETLLSTSPAGRYQSAADAEAALRGTLPQPLNPERRTRRGFAMAAITGAVLLAASIAGVTWRFASQSPAGSGRPFGLKAGDWILVSEFDNRTGESTLNGTVRAAVERELEYSDFIRVVQRDRIEDALKLLHRPLDSPLTRDLALQLSQRDGGILAVVAGNIAKAQDGYTLKTEVIDPSARSVVATLTERALAQAQVIAAIRRHTLRLRDTLGEPPASIERSRYALQRAVLPSVAALNLFTRARAMINLRRLGPVSVWVTAEKMAHEAIAQDPGFPGGPLLLAWALTNQGRQEEGLVHAQRALQLADNATPQERYFIISTVYGFTARGPDGVKSAEDRRELEKAVAALEALFALQPDHYAVRNNLRTLYQALGRDRDIGWMNLRLADARPWSVTENFDVAKQLLREGNIDGAHRYGTRAALSLSPGSSADEPDVSASVRLFPAYVAWVGDQPADVLRLLRQAAASAERHPELERRQLYLRLGAMYAAVGQLREAARAIDAARPPDENDQAKTTAVDLARAALYLDAGDRVALRAFAEARWREPLSSSAPALLGRRAPYLIEAGLLDVAERHLEWFKQRTSQPIEWAPRTPRRQFQPFYASNMAVIGLKRGQRAAVDLLRQQMTALRDGPQWLFGPAGLQTLYAASNLAEALAAGGQVSEAIATLEQAVNNRAATITSNTPNQWLRTNAELASLYRRNGQEDQARTIEARLLKLLAHADADHPLASQLKARR